MGHHDCLLLSCWGCDHMGSVVTLPHASPPGFSVQATHSTFHELHLLPASPLSGWVHWDQHWNPPFHQSLTLSPWGE